MRRGALTEFIHIRGVKRVAALATVEGYAVSISHW